MKNLPKIITIAAALGGAVQSEAGEYYGQTYRGPQIESVFNVIFDSPEFTDQRNFEYTQLDNFARVFSKMPLPLRRIFREEYPTIRLQDDRGIWQDSDVEFREGRKELVLEYDYSDNDMNSYEEIFNEVRDEFEDNSKLERKVEAVYQRWAAKMRVPTQRGLDGDEIFDIMIGWRFPRHIGNGYPHRPVPAPVPVPTYDPDLDRRLPVPAPAPRVHFSDRHFSAVADVAYEIQFWLEELWPYLNPNEMQQLIRVKQFSARLRASSGARGDAARNTRKMAVSLLREIKAQKPLLQGLMERDYAFEAIQNLYLYGEELRDILD